MPGTPAAAPASSLYGKENQERFMDDRNERDDERFVIEVETLLGSKLDPARRAEVLRGHAHGESAEALAERIESLDIARQALNDPDAPLYPPATRPDDDDPRQFTKPGTPRR
jgi:hypothetical protein